MGQYADLTWDGGRGVGVCMYQIGGHPMGVLGIILTLRRLPVACLRRPRDE